MERVQIVALIVSVLLLAVVLELVRQRRLTEEYSFLWILCSIALVVVSARRDVLDAAARWLGVYYPPMVLLMLLVVMVFVASLLLGDRVATAPADRAADRRDGGAVGGAREERAAREKAAEEAWKRPPAERRGA